MHYKLYAKMLIHVIHLITVVLHFGTPEVVTVSLHFRQCPCLSQLAIKRAGTLPNCNLNGEPSPLGGDTGHG